MRPSRGCRSAGTAPEVRRPLSRYGPGTNPEVCSAFGSGTLRRSQPRPVQTPRQGPTFGKSVPEARYAARRRLPDPVPGGLRRPEAGSSLRPIPEPASGNPKPRMSWKRRRNAPPKTLRFRAVLRGEPRGTATHYKRVWSPLCRFRPFSFRVLKIFFAFRAPRPASVSPARPGPLAAPRAFYSALPPSLLRIVRAMSYSRGEEPIR